METTDPGVAVADPAVRRKYVEERDKRRRTDGVAQFLKLADSPQFKYLQEDPWVDHAAFNAKTPVLTEGDEVKFLVLGAGYGGLLFAVRLIEAGFDAADIRLVDDAGGFGGTWYWNRYPGLMCDVESYIYMPLLEETGYMPRFRYAYGPELREHAERIAKKWGLTDKAQFRTQYHTVEWDDAQKRWILQVTENRGRTEPKREFRLKAKYVIAASGTLNAPQIPWLPGFDQFRGQHFHTSRWNYEVTGGSPEAPTLEKLKDKRVGVIGTGATAVQVVPELAKWAKHLYVFQRTPSSVDVRDQRRTDPVEWTTKIASAKGWHRARSDNFNSYITNSPIAGETDLVDDGWCRTRAFCAALGGRGIVSPDKIPEHIAQLHACDVERAERVRARTDEVVKDPETADKLKPWYPAWCKRPTFHDDYLPAFNKPNVTLVDTDGKGVDALTTEAIVANGTAYPIDVLVLSTGYTFSLEGKSPAARASAKVVGRDGLSMDDKWIQEGASTLHGVATHGFPNFFFATGTQTGVSSNFTFTLSLLSSHVAATLAEAERRADRSDRLTVEVTKAAEDAWTGEIMKRVSWFAGMSGCTPSYMNREGASDRADTQETMKAARGASWGEGVISFVEVLEAWTAEGGLKGFQIEAN